MPMDMSGLSAPIPGENFTSDTKNYPWHRPPQFDDMDKAIEYIGNKLLSEDASVAALTMMEAGVTIAALSQMYMLHGMMEGRWTFDYALLLAGPTAHILYIMAHSYGIECDLGIDNKEHPVTVSMLRAMADIKDSIDPGNAKKAALDAVMKVEGEPGAAGPAEDVQENPAPPEAPKPPQTGFMGMTPPGGAPAAPAPVAPAPAPVAPAPVQG